MTIEPLTIVEVNEAEAKGIIQHNETPVIREKTSPSDSQRVKKQSRQESVVDSEGIPDIEKMQNAGCLLGLGTDNVMINSPDMFREMDYLWKVTMGIKKKRIDPKEILKMATVNAGKILKKEIDHSDNKCNIILDPNYLTYNKIIEIIDGSNPSNNINFCFLSSFVGAGAVALFFIFPFFRFCIKILE